MSDKTESYRSGSQQTVLKVYLTLCQQPLNPTSAKALAAATGISENGVFRALKNLEIAGLAEQREGDKSWRVTPLATQTSERVRMSLADMYNTYLGDS